jgi:integrase
VPNRAPDLLPQVLDTQRLAVAEIERDLLALIVLLDLGLRKSELGAIRVRDLDLARRVLTVFGKGQKERVLPMRGRIVLAAERYLLTELPEFTRDEECVRRAPEQDDYLLYPEWRKRGRVYRADPKQPMPRQTIHRWWYEHLQRAGLVAADVERHEHAPYTAHVRD